MSRADREEPGLVVDAGGRGDFRTIVDAVAAAGPSERVLVLPGHYRETVTITRPLELIGRGQPGEVVIHAYGSDVIRFAATVGRIANLTIEQTGGDNYYAVDVVQGYLLLERSSISSRSLACVAIRGGADPRLRRNRIHDGTQGGVLVYEDALGTVEENEIFANASSGIEILENANPTIQHNRIHDGKTTGVYIHDRGLGVLDRNEIFGNALAGVTIAKDANPTLRRNLIHHNKGSGVHLYEKGLGTLEDNAIYDNVQTGVSIESGGNPTLRHNRIIRNGQEGVRIYSGGGGTIDGNDLRDNALGAWSIADDSSATLFRTDNQE